MPSNVLSPKPSWRARANAASRFGPTGAREHVAAAAARHEQLLAVDEVGPGVEQAAAPESHRRHRD
jgi:hypothetical protein